MATDAQIAANRLNALKSTGPKSDKGKARSRQNSITHGLTGAGIVVADCDEAALAERRESWRAGYCIADEEDNWLYEQIIVSSIRIDRCQRIEPTLRANAAARAEHSWDEDRRLAAEILGAALNKKPGLATAKLRQTIQGCQWLIDRWVALGEVLEKQEKWDDMHTSLAFDLLGTPHEFRANVHWNDRTAIRALIDEEVANLQETHKKLAPLDESERQAILHGFEIEPSRASKLLQRYENTCLRRMIWAKKQLGKPRAERETRPTVATTPTPTFRAAIPQPASEPPAQNEANSDDMSIEEREQYYKELDYQLYRQLMQARGCLPPHDDSKAQKAAPAPKTPPLNRRARRAAMKLQVKSNSR